MSDNSQYDEHHNEGEAGYYRDLLLDEPGNPDHVIRQVGVDKVIVEKVNDANLINIDGELKDIPF